MVTTAVAALSASAVTRVGSAGAAAVSGADGAPAATVMRRCCTAHAVGRTSANSAHIVRRAAAIRSDGVPPARSRAAPSTTPSA